MVERLAGGCTRDGKAGLFAHARTFLTLGSAAIPYDTAARELGMDEGALRVAVHRLRRRYRELLRDEIAQTLTDPAAVEEELKSLLAALTLLLPGRPG